MDIENNTEKYYCQENVIEFIKNESRASVTFTQGKYISKIKKLAEKFPDECQIISEKDGVLLAHIPTKWIKINNPKKMELTDEQREIIKKRLERSRGFIDDLPFSDFGYEEEYEDEE